MILNFISIDSSLANTGIALGTIIDNDIFIKDIFLIETKKSKVKNIRVSSDTIQRCRSTYIFIQSHIITYNPDIIFMETPSGSQNASGMKSYGATCQLISVLTPPPVEVTPIETKIHSVGKKQASKRSIINWAYNKYPDLHWLKRKGHLIDKNEHMADAIAICYAGIKTQEYQRLLSITNINRIDSV
jgi:Holliday junction resolvasome RuvABC endonuclease subunit